jgi:hypothetical protein
LESATAILTHYVRSGKRLFTDDLWTFTRCHELIDDKNHACDAGHSCRDFVGAFSLDKGLHIYYDHTGNYDSGVACCRKFQALGT